MLKASLTSPRRCQRRSWCECWMNSLLGSTVLHMWVFSSWPQMHVSVLFSSTYLLCTNAICQSLWLQSCWLCFSLESVFSVTLSQSWESSWKLNKIVQQLNKCLIQIVWRAFQTVMLNHLGFHSLTLNAKPIWFKFSFATCISYQYSFFKSHMVHCISCIVHL